MSSLANIKTFTRALGARALGARKVNFRKVLNQDLINKVTADISKEIQLCKLKKDS